MATDNVTTAVYLITNITNVTRSEDAHPSRKEVLDISHLTSARMILVVTFIGAYFLITVTSNGLALVVLFKKAFRKNSFAIGQRVLSVLDIILAFTVLLKYFITGETGNYWNATMCRVYKTFYYTILASLNWTIVYLSTVRFAALKYPLKINTHIFIRRSYLSLICITTFVSLFYTVMYHEVTRILGHDDDPTDIEECFSYLDFPINQYLFRGAIMSVETLFPAVLIVIVNTLTFREYRNVSIKRGQLKEAVMQHSQNISKIKSKLNVTESKSRLKLTDLPKKSSDANHSTTTVRASASTDESSPQGILKQKVTYRVSSNVSTNVDSHGLSKKPPSRELLLQRLKYEQLYLRRTTRAYVSLKGFESETVPISISLISLAIYSDSTCDVNSKASCEQGVDEKVKPHEEQKAESEKSIKCLLRTVTLLFLLFNTPQSIYYIFAPLVFSQSVLRKAQYQLGEVIFQILMCLGHNINTLMYIFFSTKVQQHVQKLADNLINKYNAMYN